MELLLNHPKAKTFKITALMRDESKARKLQSIGVSTVIGSLDDSAILEQQASNADVIIHTVCPPYLSADADRKLNHMLVIGRCR